MALRTLVCAAQLRRHHHHHHHHHLSFSFIVFTRPAHASQWASL
jgi:hypothetical protein